MDQFWLYFKLGAAHIMDLHAYIHILFLMVLVASYSAREGARLFWLVSIFMIAHTATLLLAIYDIVEVNTAWLEFLMPLTILITAIYSIFTAGKKVGHKKINVFFIFSLFFGLVHGLGFENTFHRITGTMDSPLMPLLEFSLGIEIGQIIVVLILLIFSFVFQNLFRFSQRDWMLMISALVLGLSIPMLVENWIF